MEGRVLEIQDNRALVLRSDEFEEWVGLSELVKELKEFEALMEIQDFDFRRVREKEARAKRKVSASSKGEQVWEVDLHFENLVDRIRGLTNGEILNIQINHCRFKIDQAMERKVDKLVIVHGVGQGVLRAEVHALLHSYNLKFYDASFAKYGRGATEVEIRQRP